MSDIGNDFSSIELADNSDPRCPVILILDSSSSMADVLPGETESALEALNSGLDTLVTELNRDPLARRRVDISIVTYGTHVSEPTPFSTVDKLILPTLVPSGTTSMGAAVEVALDALEARKREYRAAGTDLYKPWVLLITDGLPTDDITAAAERVRDYEAGKKLQFFSVGVEGADFEQLSRFSAVREPMKLKGVKFAELFMWLSASQAAVSASTPGDTGVKLPSPGGWAEIAV